MNVSPFKAAYPKTELITSPSSFFSTIKHQYIEYRDNGIYKDYSEAGYYVLQIKSEKSSHLGILTMTEVKEMGRYNVLKHEKTLASKEQNMMHLLLQRKALVKPVLLGYKPNATISGIMKKYIKKKPLLKIDFEEDNEIHTIWAISETSHVENISKAFSKVKKAYIGDGHHRSTTIQLLSKTKQLGKEAKKYNNLYTAYFPFDQLRICDYNRMVDISEIMSLPEFIIALSKYFEMEKIDGPTKPDKKHKLTTYMDGNWYAMTWKKKYLSKNKKTPVLLDSALVNKYIFEDILGIDDVRTDTRINYYGGTQPLSKIVNAANKKRLGIGICIRPVEVKELTAIANKKQTLPPKSTWFLPRLKSGILTIDL